MWVAPDVVTAGSPVHAAFMIAEGDGPQEHVDMNLSAWLDGQLLVEAWTHEHDGFHGLTVTPPTSGTLDLVAVTGPEQRTVKTLEIRPPTDTTTSLLRDADLFLGESLDRRWVATSGAFDGRAYHDMDVLWMIHDDGRLRVLTSATIHGGSRFEYGPALGDATVEALFTGPDNLVEAGVWGATHREAQVVGPGPTAPTVASEDEPPATTCDLPVVADPKPGDGPTWTWSVNSDIRWSVVNPTPELGGGNAFGHTYRLERAVGDLLPTTDEWDLLWMAQAHDPWSQITFSVPQAGTYRMHVTPMGLQPGPACTIDFTATDPQAVPGRLEAGLDIRGRDLTGTLRALDAQGAPLGHYEFLVVAYQDDPDTGALEWTGKLHGHDGRATFHLGALPPGDHTVRVFPSAQDPEAPVLAGGPFQWTLHVEDPTRPEEQQASGVGGAAAIGVVAVALLARRTRSDVGR